MDDGSPWRWQGFTSFLLYKKYLDGEDISDRIREAVNVGANLIRVFGMSRWMDGGETDATQFWPQKYPDFYAKLPTFINLLAAYGMRCEFVVFADAREIMPKPDEQAAHLKKVVAKLRDLPSACLEIENEYSVNKETDIAALVHQDWGDLLYSVGDYDMERIDVKQPDGSFKADPRPPMLTGRYVTYHGDRSPEGSLIEAAKEGFYYYAGWDSINHDGNRSHADGCKRPCVNDEPMGANDQPSNRWGDERYTDPEHARSMGAGHALSSAGGTFHSERGCTSSHLSETELQCARAYFAGMAAIPVDAPTYPYEHDRTAGHVLAPVPQFGPDDYAAKESVSRASGNVAHALTVLISHGYVPEGQHGWQVTDRQGKDGGIMRVERA